MHEFAEGHNTGLFSCLCCGIVNIVPGQIDEVVKDNISMPLSIGGMGLRSAHRTSPLAYWASWADSLPMIRERHPEVARTIIDRAGRPNPPPSLESAVRVARDLEGVHGFEVPSWEALSLGERPAPREPDEFEPGGERHGWQHEAASRVEKQHREGLLPRLTESEQAQLQFRVLLQRRLRLPLPLSARQCRCGRPLDILGHRRAARAGFLGRRGSQWRAPGLASAGRQEAEWSRMPCSEVLTWQIQIPKTEDESRSWQTGCPCSEAPNWRWTPPSRLLSIATVLGTPGRPRGWSSLGCGQAQEGENLLRAGQPSGESSVGGPGWGGWRPVVGGEQAVPDPSGKSPSEV